MTKIFYMVCIFFHLRISFLAEKESVLFHTIDPLPAFHSESYHCGNDDRKTSMEEE